MRNKITLLVFGLAICTSLAAGNPKPKAGMCHTCKCDAKAEKCVRDCGDKKSCKILCAHDCSMKAHGIKACPKPIR